MANIIRFFTIFVWVLILPLVISEQVGQANLSKILEPVTGGSDNDIILQTIASKPENLEVTENLDNDEGENLETVKKDVENDAEITTLKERTEFLENEIKSLKDSLKSIVPVGYIYVQLSSQEAPASLWPSLTWRDVTSDYAGLFFRALGGASNSFGSIQASQSPTLTVKWHGEPASELSYHPPAVKPNEDYGKLGVWTGFYSSTRISGKMGLKFKLGSEEVRPVNSAVRIWKRVA